MNGTEISSLLMKKFTQKQIFKRVQKKLLKWTERCDQKVVKKIQQSRIFFLETVRKSINSSPNTLEACLKAEGDHFKYNFFFAETNKYGGINFKDFTYIY